MSDNTQARQRREVRSEVEPAEDLQRRRRGVEQRAAVTATSNEEAEERMSVSTPTPTQEENDLAKVGALELDSLQDDGSGPDPNAPPIEEPPPINGDTVTGGATQRRHLGPGGAAGEYRTRAAAPPPTPTPAPPRQPSE